MDRQRYARRQPTLRQQRCPHHPAAMVQSRQHSRHPRYRCLGTSPPTNARQRNRRSRRPTNRRLINYAYRCRHRLPNPRHNCAASLPLSVNGVFCSALPLERGHESTLQVEGVGHCGYSRLYCDLPEWTPEQLWHPQRRWPTPCIQDTSGETCRGRSHGDRGRRLDPRSRGATLPLSIDVRQQPPAGCGRRLAHVPRPTHPRSKEHQRQLRDQANH